MSLATLGKLCAANDLAREGLAPKAKYNVIQKNLLGMQRGAMLLVKHLSTSIKIV